MLQDELDRTVALRSKNDKSGCGGSGISDVVAIPAEELMDHGSDTFEQAWTNEISNAASMTEQSPLHQTNMDLRYGCSSSSKV